MEGDDLRVRRVRRNERLDAKLERVAGEQPHRPEQHVQRPGGAHPITLRDSRLGVKVAAPKFEGIKTTGLLEFDFFANPGTYSGNTLASSNITETSYYNNGIFRMRHGWVKFETDVIDILGGQTYNVFGGQPYFFPCSADYLPVPNEAYGRVAQLRLSKTFKSDAVNVQIDLAAVRPPQRDSTIPQGEAALRVSFPGRKGIHTPGGGGTGADAAAIGVSGVARRFKVNQFRATGQPTDSSTDTGWAVAADALLPIIPVKNSDDRGNALTVVSEFTMGSGYADMLLGNPGGLTFPNAPGTTTAFAANIDNGMVTYDPSGNGVLHTLDFQTFLAGIQYYLPPSGRFSVSANYSHGESKNIVSLVGGKRAAGLPASSKTPTSTTQISFSTLRPPRGRESHPILRRRPTAMANQCARSDGSPPSSTFSDCRRRRESRVAAGRYGIVVAPLARWCPGSKQALV